MNSDHESLANQSDENRAVNKNYPVKYSPELDGFLQLCENQTRIIKEARGKNASLWEQIQFKLRADWTYHSNSIEGSTLTRGETIFFLREGLTVEGKPFKDFADSKNHSEAIDFLFEVIVNNRPITQGLIKEINAILLAGITFTEAVTPEGVPVKKAATPGEYKSNPNHVLQLDGTLHEYVEPLQVVPEMERLVAWIDDTMNEVPAPVIAAIAHYNMVRIHPFDDGNGRGARILMNLILMKQGYDPAIIKTEQKRKYYEALQQADNGDLEPFIQFVVSQLIETQQEIIQDLHIK